MQKSKFTKSQIVAAIKKKESGIPVKEIGRELNIKRWYRRNKFFHGLSVQALEIFL